MAFPTSTICSSMLLENNTFTEKRNAFTEVNKI